MEHYTKPYPVCRWAHPAVDAALALRQGLRQPSAALVERVEVETFAPAVRLATRLPATTEEAQYSLPFCVAAALVHGRLGVSEIDGMGLRDGEVARLSTSMTIWERPSYSERFPEQRCAQVTLVLRDGHHVVTEIASAKGDPSDPLSAAELDEKYRSLTEPALGRDGSDRVRAAVSALGAADSTVGRLLDAVFQAPAPRLSAVAAPLRAARRSRRRSVAGLVAVMAAPFRRRGGRRPGRRRGRVGGPDSPPAAG
jgi:2-methylcitrate dehydratase PrpD